MIDAVLSRSITSGDIPTAELLLEHRNINQKYQDGNVLLWAITGSTYNQLDPIGKGKLHMLTFLLENGADPNLTYLVYPAIYYATNEKNHNMIVELLNYGADPNAYYLKVKKEGYSEVCLCKTSLIHAIDNGSYLCVEALINRDAIFNDCTIKYASDIRDKLLKKRKESREHYLDYQNAENICVALQNKYNNSYEHNAENYMKQNFMTHSRVNYFVGMEK